MKYRDLFILLPCYSLEDFPQHHVGREAEGLLACWTALWHPALIASAEAMPKWHRTDDPLEDYTDRLIVIPEVSQQDLSQDTERRIGEDGSHILRGLHDREQILAAALEPLPEKPSVEEPVVRDFLALGYCYLQIELLTRQMRYSSNLDEEYFEKQLVTAATAAVEGDSHQTQEHLSKCFDVLGEERDHYYPVDAYVLDLVLIAPSTMGRGLRREVSGDVPVNLFLPASVLEIMAQQQPESMAAIAQALERGNCCIVGGPARELPTPLLSCETILRQLLRGSHVYRQQLGQRPLIYGRRRFGLTPALPQILHKLGFDGALHATLDGGRFPESSQSKTQWEGIDGTSIDVLARIPLDATQAGTFLNLAAKIGESMETDYVATIGLAHWAGQSSPWFEDLKRCTRYTSALGKLATLTEFFEQTEHAGHLDRFQPDQYRSPYLKQAVARHEADPISRFVRYWNRWALQGAGQAMTVWAATLGGPLPETETSEDDTDQDLDSGGGDGGPAPVAAAGDRLREEITERAAALAELLAPEDGTSGSQYLLINPHVSARRTCVHLPDMLERPGKGGPIYAVGESATERHAVVDVPAAGFVGLPADKGPSAADPSPSLADPEERLLRNEFFEARFDPHTGALRSIYDYHSRGNRLSQQLALRSSSIASRSSAGNAEDAPYSVMAADSVEVTQSGAATAEITSQGKLVDATGRPLADFKQRSRIWRGSRVMLLDVDLHPTEMPGPDPWKSYYACRFAWSDEAADVYRSVNLTRQPTEARRLEAPLFVEIDNDTTRTTIFSLGLPYHRRIGLRKLDSLLIVRGETARHFRMAIGIDVKGAVPEALGILAPPRLVRRDAVRPTLRTGWLFHVNGRTVIATAWDCLITSAPKHETGPRARVVGFRVRLLETAGKSGRVTVRAFRPVVSAREVDFSGRTLADCEVTDGAFHLEMSPYQWSEIEARWEEEATENR